ncbi:MAG TPA: CoA-binding protein [Candidatus Kapabacteria bacterium]|jgi:predicted CoA-binding protein|nr:CoA-binding protein [Candidatus Kapabacteria bacterium]HOM05535.1 CoA-binding protein [Candidatus Kapabacteria bacterium]HOQ49670.1 CoA-binding protein [Candidatus Kapabacteria bacterium]HPU23361.1 CoA-binding protein [Candidatus Kapabacteria bacterium]
MQNKVNEFLKDSSPVIIGVSTNKNAWGNELFRLFFKNGYKPIPISRSCNEIEGIRTFASIDDLPQQSLNLIFSIPPKETEKILLDAEKGKIKSAWFVFGSKPNNISQIAAEKDIEIIYGYCPMMFLNRKGIHRFHYLIKSWFSS